MDPDAAGHEPCMQRFLRSPLRLLHAAERRASVGGALFALLVSGCTTPVDIGCEDGISGILSAEMRLAAERSATLDPITNVENRGFGVVPFDTDEPKRPRLRYRDGQLAPLNHCAIRLANKLNPRIPPCYINGLPVGFC